MRRSIQRTKNCVQGRQSKNSLNRVLQADEPPETANCTQGNARFCTPPSLSPPTWTHVEMLTLLQTAAQLVCAPSASGAPQHCGSRGRGGLGRTKTSLHSPRVPGPRDIFQGAQPRATTAGGRLQVFASRWAVRWRASGCLVCRAVSVGTGPCEGR